MATSEPSVEERIEAAVAHYRTIYPEPWPLSPNLALAVEVMEKGLATNEWASEVSDLADHLSARVERLEARLETVRALAEHAAHWAITDNNDPPEWTELVLAALDREG